MCFYISLAELNMNTNQNIMHELTAANQVTVAQTVENVDIPENVSSVYVGTEDYAKIIENPVLIDDALWEVSDDRNDDLISGTDAVNAMFSLYAPLEARYRGFYFAEGTLRLSLYVQGTAAAQGRAVLVAIPNTRRETSPDGIWTNHRTFNNLRILPHVFIDPSKTASYTLDLPLLGPRGVMDIQGAYKSWAYYVTVYDPLGSGNDSVPRVNMELRATLIDVKLRGKVVPDAIAYGLENESNEKNQFSSGLRRLSKFAGSLPNLPPTATLFSEIGGKVADLLQEFGYSRQPATHFSELHFRTGDSLTQVDGASSSTVVGRSQLISSALGNSLMCGSGNEMSISSLLDYPIPRLCTIVEHTIPPGYLLSTIRVTPADAIIEGEHLASMLFRRCEAWTGQITYSFEFVCSVFHRATLLIAYAPDSNEPSYDEAMNSLESFTVTISGNTHVKWTIPWRQPQAATQGHNGTIYIFVANPVTSNGSTDPIHMDVMANFKDVTFHFPQSSANYHNEQYKIDPYSSDWIESSDFSLVGSDGCELMSIVGGDPVRTLKDLVTRAYKVEDYKEDENSYTAYKHAPFVGELVGWFDILTPCFYGWRSSLRYHIIPKYRPDGPAQALRLRVSHHAVQDHAMDVMPVSDNQRNAEEIFNTSIVNGADVTIPFVAFDRNFSPGQEFGYEANAMVVHGDIPGTHCEVWRAAGDDYSVGFFLGVPYVEAAL